MREFCHFALLLGQQSQQSLCSEGGPLVQRVAAGRRAVINHHPDGAGAQLVHKRGPPAEGASLQVAAAARLMVADGCGLWQRPKHAEDDEGEL